MSVLEAFILGLIQGLTEFLPISSSGHLVIAQYYFDIQQADLAFAIILHLGTLVAIVAAYNQAVCNIIKEFFLMVRDIFVHKSPRLKTSKYRYYIIYIIIASIPAALAGILFNDYIEAAFSSIYVVAVTLFLTAIILMVAEKFQKNNVLRVERMGPVKAFIVGIFQMLAIIPGISRSGTTMTGGVVCGLQKEDALELSFLMAIPAILGSLLLEIKDVLSAVTQISILPVAVGFFTSMAVGYLSINLFKKIVKKGSMAVFSAYLIVLSVLVIITI